MNKLKYLLISVAIIAFSETNAQFDIKGKIKSKSTDRAEQKTDEGIDKGIDGVENGVKSLFKKKDKSNKTEKTNKDENINPNNDENNNNNNPEKTTQNPAKGDENTFKSYSKYDYIPGEKTVFFEDFSQDKIGDLPDKWNTNSSGEVVTLSNHPGNWFKVKADGTYYPEALTKFPENFTLDMDIVSTSTSSENPACIEIDFIQTLPEVVEMDGLVPGKGGFGLQLWDSRFFMQNWLDGNYAGVNQDYDTPLFIDSKGKLIHLAFMAQKQRIKLYYAGNKIFDMPRLLPAGVVLNRLRFYLSGCHNETTDLFISNIRLAEGAPDMRSKLITEGKLVTHGINFDSGSDKIKPESYGTLKEIAQVLKENPAVKVKIIGHTDSDGGEKLNLDLSNKRAAAVKNMLSSEFNIDASRMNTEGKGMSQPISPNTTTEGKANNRRVEFIKL